jgi:hypothetical protein
VNVARSRAAALIISLALRASLMASRRFNSDSVLKVLQMG